MSRRARYRVISLFILLAWGSGWLMLWTLGFYLTHSGQQAALFLPHGVYLALLILLSRRYWPALVLPPMLALYWLRSEQLLNGDILLIVPLISLLPARLVQRAWHRFPLYWQRLTLLLAAVTATALLNTALLSPWIKSPALLLGLSSFTGGVLLTPFVYLIFDFLRQQHRYHLLGLDTNNPPLRASLLIWCSLFFIIGIGTQMVLSPEIERLLLMVVFLPNVVMAWKFGWQGGVLSGLLGSMMITIARQIGVGFSNLLELEIFLATQALLGIGLGIAISRQQHLAQNLHHYRQRLESELAARRALTEQLVHTEENTRKRLARELHDEIGQNITAIQIQSQLLRQRQEPALVLSAAAQINDLARRIHLSTRQLLRQLRPPALDELSFQEALYHLVNEFAFAERGIRCRFDYRLDAPPAGETVQFTLYRLLQELLNNVCKHADASAVSIVLRYHAPCLHLLVQDNGVGIGRQSPPGQGIQGMRERVHALGGELTLASQRGTRVIVKLPTVLQRAGA
ncbi:MASE1 domain-containing sensor histidine kinase [Edwardsiella piscicida]|uniref:MASE1 domain-containing sensor histidine kinase n=1 Tax=Edwardsiella piscicida TaxID=1263550 RepID=UPI0002C07ECB|nr:MASE1 domain-containing protein [Edwardsiella piscicida]AGH73381.1 Sensor histidine protein kinase UhpB, glucose-6-phosphate specific [Edwardsiella piscicida C07-087]EKS7779067.1 MASE1 domain-containing protein [Edwardsiella piscicida]EKS7782487.1 MASE1 domain-containing protein [Edwardsiella piscicida]EKS7811928.1 MASE1 domain-containing protein [Edwardsiella piscicida]UCQ22296.1 MASE1 domain-containing protein [Edwardsiella piscicida]